MNKCIVFGRVHENVQNVELNTCMENESRLLRGNKTDEVRDHMVYKSDALMLVRRCLMFA